MLIIRVKCENSSDILTVNLLLITAMYYILYL